jgi:hypothetical protein
MFATADSFASICGQSIRWLLCQCSYSPWKRTPNLLNPTSFVLQFADAIDCFWWLKDQSLFDSSQRFSLDKALLQELSRGCRCSEVGCRWGVSTANGHFPHSQHDYGCSEPRNLQVHHEGCMVDGQETILHWVPAPWVTMVVSSVSVRKWWWLQWRSKVLLNSYQWKKK